MKSYKDLEVYTLSTRLAIEVHHMSLKLPQFELFETGSQIRRSSKSIPANITEGYGRNRYKQEFIKFLVYAHSSNDETIHHLTMIKLLYDHMDVTSFLSQYDELGRKINNFIQYVENNWNDSSKFTS